MLLDDVGDLRLSLLARKGSFQDTSRTRPPSPDSTNAPPDQQQEQPQTGPYVSNKKYMYTLDDLRRIMRYAEDRGIVVVPEVDVPAHAL